MSKKVSVIGAGFSGLVSAYYLSRAGHQVTVYEKSDKCGGLLQTKELQLGLVESAANGLLNNFELEELCAQIGLNLLFPSSTSRARYIYRGQAHRWPLKLMETVAFLPKILRLLSSKSSRRPHEGESLASWCRRVLGEPALHYLVAPALQGIFAGNPEKLSASLVMAGFFSSSSGKRAKKRGLVSFLGGMGEFTGKLESYLRSEGVEFRYGEAVEELTGDTPTVICTSISGAGEILKDKKLLEAEALPLVSVTQFYKRREKDLKGFGCLFPQTEGFNSLGVLWNSEIFQGRSDQRSETWILGGALKPEVIDLDDSELLAVIADDRARIYGENAVPIQSHISRWPQALPNYSLDLEQRLKSISLPPNVYLCGNYLGQIGLSKIILRAQDIARQV